jgi:RNA polymerase sigma-70 factor (ECF subfamily)
MHEAPDEPADDELVAAYAAGDGRAFERLFARHRRGLYTWFLLQCGHEDQAEDLFQEVFLRLIRSATAYQPAGQFRAWLFTIAHNVLTDGRRRAAMRKTMEDDMHTKDSFERGSEPVARWGEGDPVLHTGAKELTERLARALLGLPAEQREVFLLRQRGGLELAASARVTGANLSTVKSRLRYALAGLRRALGDELLHPTEIRHD